MVLQDVNNPTPDNFTDNPYPSEKDPYASQPTTGFRFDPTIMPQPLPVVGFLMGYSSRAVRSKVETTMKFAESKVGRPLTPEESQALGYHLYQIEQTASYFAATGAALGTWRWYSTWDKMRYPFYQPKVENIDHTKFWLTRHPMAPFARQTWRLSLYILVAGTMGTLLGGMIAQPLAAVNSSKDPKLEQFGADLKAAAAQAMDQRRGQQEGDMQQRRREFQEQVRNRTGGGPSPQARWGKQAPVKNEEDDSSPTAGNEAWGSTSPPADSWEKFSNDAQQSAPQRQQNGPSTEARNRRPPPQQSEAPAPLLFDDDDATPTGGLFQDEFNNPQSQSQSQSRPGESSWDRLRRGGVAAPLQRPPQQQSRRAEPRRKDQGDGSGMGDSFSGNDEDRKMERERAQQEFDARLERERQGRDFESDGGKKW